MASISFFVTGIPGDEEERAGMALQYPLPSASAIQASQIFCFLQKDLIQQTQIHLYSPRFGGIILRQNKKC